MRYPAPEKPEIIRLVEQSHLSVRKPLNLRKRTRIWLAFLTKGDQRLGGNIGFKPLAMFVRIRT